MAHHSVLPLLPLPLLPLPPLPLLFLALLLVQPPLFGAPAANGGGGSLSTMIPIELVKPWM
jgi:hypothetical protein